MRSRLLHAFMGVLFCCLPVRAADDVDRYMEAQLRQLHIPGASLAVVRDGRIVKAAGYGVANIELNAPAIRSTVYEIGSNTKQFTGAAVMMLVEDGKLSLDDPVTKYFPRAPESWKAITVRHLLTHTSGIQNHVPERLGTFRWNLFGETFPSHDEILDMFFQLPLEFSPGETWAYDNTGYHLLGTIIEKAAGVPYWQFLDDRIFKPLGMKSTRNTDRVPLVPNRASGYEWVGGGFENRPPLPPFVGFSAGSLLSTVEDLARWDAALYGERLLKRASLERMMTPAKTSAGARATLDYGFGFFLDNYHGHRLVQHGGGTPGFASIIHRYVDDRLTVIILTNHSDRVLDQMAIDIAGMYVPALKRPEGARDPDPKTTERVKAIFAGLLAGRHDPAEFTAPMQIFLKTTTGKGFWQWFAAHGSLDALVYSDSDKSGELRVLRYQTILGGNRYWFSVKLTSEGKIAQISCW